MKYSSSSIELPDWRDPRDWKRIWRDPPRGQGFWCCCGGVQMYTLGGGDPFLTTVYKTCDKTDMTAETTAAVSTGNLSSNRYAPGAAANPGVAGYCCAGNTSTTVSVTTGDKLTFSNDTTVAVSGTNLSQGRSQLAALSERSTKAYFAGGLISGGGVVKSKVCDKLAFASDTSAATTSADLSSQRSGPSGLNGNSTKGYWAGGTTGGVFNAVVTSEKLTFSSDTTSAVSSANLSLARLNMQSGSDGSAKGYWFCGQSSSGGISNVDKITVSTDTTAATTSAAVGQAYAAASGSDGNKLFALGGDGRPSGAASTNGSKITFATDVSSALAAGSNLSQGRQLPAGITTVAL